MRTIWILALLVIVLVRAVGFLDDPPAPLNDPAVRNVITLVCVLVASMATWFWFCLGSAYSRKLRWTVAVLSACLFVGVVTLIAKLNEARVLNFSGSLIPRLSRGQSNKPEVISEELTGRADFHSPSELGFPQFLGPDRNSRIDHVALQRDWQSQPPKTIWSRAVGTAWSAFAANEQYAVTMEQRGEQEWVTCYEVATGQPVWGHAIQSRHETTLGGVGPRSTPTIHQGFVYALGASGVIRCLDEEGQLVWSDDLRARYGVSQAVDEENVFFGRAASPLVVDALVIVPGGGPTGRAKNLVAFDRITGKLVWESECKLPDGTSDQISYASPAIATLAGREQILIVNESTASGHDVQTGHQLWSHPWPGRSNGNASASQPLPIDSEHVLLTKGYGGGAELLKLQSNDQTGLVVNSVWKVARVLQTKFSNVVVYQGHAYGLSEGILECVDIETGKRLWKRGRYGHGQILGVQDLLLVMSEEGELHLVEMNPQKLVELASHPLLEGKTWNNLCLIGKKLLARNAEQAVCVELP